MIFIRVVKENETSEVLSIEQKITLSENNVSCIPNLILLSDVNHVKIFLIVEHIEGLISVKVGDQCDWEEWPHNKLLNHELSENGGKKSGCCSIGDRSDVAIVDILSANNIGPVTLDWSSVFVGLSIQYVGLNEEHSQVDSGLVFFWDATEVLVEVVEVVLIRCLEFLAK